MTLIEFYEKDAIENICSSLAKTPERVVLIGDTVKHMQKHIERYQTVLSSRKVNVEFVCRTVNKNKMQDIINLFSPSHYYEDEQPICPEPSLPYRYEVFR